mgnify:CR=1 FL=1
MDSPLRLVSVSVDVKVHHTDGDLVYFEQQPEPDDHWRVDTDLMRFHLRLLNPDDRALWDTRIGAKYSMVFLEGWGGVPS